jgi:hypothetical protein
MAIMSKTAAWAVLTLGLANPGAAATLQEATVAAFDAYIRQTEQRIAGQVSGKSSFLWSGASAARREQVMKGETAAQPWNSRPEIEVTGGLIHDWIGAVFIPGTNLITVLNLVRDYDNHYRIYAPEVIASKTLSREGDHYRVHLRLLKKKVITVVLNSEHDVQYYRDSPTRWHSRSYSTRIAEVDNPGAHNERELPPDDGHGFLWRLYSYWRFEERDGGVYVECQAISLTRAIPAGLGWLIEPIIRELPKESLVRTLEGTRQALAKR